MSLRGFGMRFDTQTGICRHWYVASDGVMRWVDNDKPVDPATPPTTDSKET